MSIKFVLRFALFSARPRDSRKDQFWTPVTIKQHYVHYVAILLLQESKFEGYCCHGAWPKITQNEKRKTQNKLDRHEGVSHQLWFRKDCVSQVEYLVVSGMKGLIGSSIITKVLFKATTSGLQCISASSHTMLFHCYMHLYL